MNPALVGAFVLVFGGALIAVALWLASGGATSRPVDLYLAIVDESVAGLNVNAPVKFNGVDVGQVRSIRLDPANPKRVRLMFAIERGTPIQADTEAVLKSQGLTGIAYVELADTGTGSLPPRAVPPEIYPQIRTKASLSATLENVMFGVLAKLDRTTGNIDTLLSSANQQALSQALADVALLTKTLAARRHDIDTGIQAAARTADNAARASAQLGAVMDGVARSAAAVEKLGNQAASASTGAGRTVDAVGADAQRLLAELQALSTALRRFSEQTERQPASLLFGRSPVPDGPGETPGKAP